MKFDAGHLKSQKFAGFIFGSLLCLIAGICLSEGKGSGVVMGIVGMYTAFVGGRAWSDGQARKYGTTLNSVDIAVTQRSALKNNKLPPKKDGEEEEEGS